MYQSDSITITNVGASRTNLQIRELNVPSTGLALDQAMDTVLRMRSQIFTQDDMDAVRLGAFDMNELAIREEMAFEVDALARHLTSQGGVRTRNEEFVHQLDHHTKAGKVARHVRQTRPEVIEQRDRYDMLTLRTMVLAGCIWSRQRGERSTGHCSLTSSALVMQSRQNVWVQVLVTTGSMKGVLSTQGWVMVSDQEPQVMRGR